MGFNSTVFILNDCLGDVAKDPKLGELIAQAINLRTVEDGPVPVGNGVYVVETHHADSTAIVAVGGNRARILGHVPTALGEKSFEGDEKGELNMKLRELCIQRGMRDPLGKGPKPTLAEVKELAKEYGWRCVVLRRKSLGNDTPRKTKTKKAASSR